MLMSVLEMVDRVHHVVEYEGKPIALMLGPSRAHAVDGVGLDALCGSEMYRPIPSEWEWRAPHPAHIARCAACLALFPGVTEFRPPWSAITDDDERRDHRMELLSELPPGHPLFDVWLRPEARRANPDALVLRLEDRRWAIVSLLWRRTTDHDELTPPVEIFEDAEGLAGRIWQDIA